MTWIQKQSNKPLRLRVVHPFSWWGQHKKVFAWPAFGQHSPRLLSCSQVTISVVALLAEGCLATSNALCGLCKKENPGPVGRNYLGASPAARWLASWVQLGKKLSEAFGNHASFLALINNTTLGFRPPVFCDERYLSKICCRSLGYSHTPMPCLFVVKWNNCHWARLDFTPHLLRENKLQHHRCASWEILGFLRSPCIIFFSERNVNATTNPKSQIQT